VNPSHEPAARQYEQAPPYEQAPAYDGPPAYPYGPPPEVVGWEAPRPRRRPWGRTALVTACVTAAMAAAGAPLGLLWSWLAPSVPVINAGQNGIVVNDPSPEEYIAADGWFTLICFAFGLVAAVLVWLVARRDRGPGLVLGVSLGGLGTALVMWGVGRMIGMGAWNDWRQSSSAGDTFERPPDLHAHGALLVAAFAAVIVTTLLAGWSNDPDLERPGAKPGYGHDLDGPNPIGPGSLGPNTLGPNPVGPNTLGPGPVGPDSGGPGPVGPGPVGPDSGGPDSGGPDSGGPDSGGPDSGGPSSGLPGGPDPTAAPAPPAPWPTDPPRG
jgi:hypothetical protein